ncbi:Hypothetical protein FKW44_010772, partial [Caligus rogercresseyi]
MPELGKKMFVNPSTCPRRLKRSNCHCRLNVIRLLFGSWRSILSDLKHNGDR